MPVNPEEDRIDHNDPKSKDIFADMYASLKAQCHEQNKISMAEFEHFRPMFTKGAAPDAVLTNEFVSRFNLFAPIEVYSHVGATEPLFVIPAVHAPWPVVNDIEDGPEALDHFVLTQAREVHPFRLDHLQAKQRVVEMVSKMGNQAIESQLTYSDLINAPLTSAEEHAVSDDQGEANFDDGFDWN